jgi:hypothetical protein
MAPELARIEILRHKQSPKRRLKYFRNNLEQLLPNMAVILSVPVPGLKTNDCQLWAMNEDEDRNLCARTTWCHDPSM